MKKKLITHKYERVAFVHSWRLGSFDDFNEDHLGLQWLVRFSEAELNSMLGKNVIVTIEVMK